MKLSALSQLDKSFELVSSLISPLEEEVKGVTDLKSKADHFLLFVKNKKFLTSHAKLGLVLEKKFFDSLPRENVENLKKDSLFLATVLDVNFAIGTFSKYFYEKNFRLQNPAIDGRITSSASIHPTALISQNVFIGDGVEVGAHVVIHPGVVIMAGSKIEDYAEIFPHVTIYPRVVIGKNVRLHSGTVIGADGFGYNFFQGEHVKVWHMGGVHIHHDVEIGANSCVDSGTFSPTVIGAGSKLDNLVQVGHNSTLGIGVILCGGVAIAGSATLHNYVVVGGKSAIGNGVEVGMGASIAGFSGVTTDVPPKATFAGFPAREHKEWLKGLAILRKLSLKRGEN